MTKLKLLVLLVLTLPITVSAETKAYPGNLHAHSQPSDGLETVTAQEAYAYSCVAAYIGETDPWQNKQI